MIKLILTTTKKFDKGERFMQIITEKEFDEKIKNGVVLIDFFATWCGPCRMLTPILEEVSDKLDGKASFYKVDVL